MVEAWFSLFADIEEELSKGRETAEQIQRLGEKLKNRFERVAKAIKHLEQDDWSWETNFKYIIFIKNISEKNAKKEFKRSGIDMDLLRFNVPL